jgi:hypothetical protein
VPCQWSGGVTRSNAGSLADLQRGFQDYLLQKSDGFLDAVRDTRKASRDTLAGVYRDGYALRLIEVLTIDYPGLLAMAGPADFEHMARAYIRAHPSHHPSARWFGRDLPGFVAITPPYNTSLAVSDMARFEWTLGEVFDSPDAVPVKADAVMALPPQAWEELRFTPLPSFRRVTLAHAAPVAYQRREEVQAGDLEVDAYEQPVTWGMWRPELISNFRSLEPDEAALLGALVAGKSFPEICDAAIDFVGEDQAAGRAAGLLRAWVEEGMIAGFFTGD